MPTYRFQTVDVFSETRFGGNPLAVFPDARGLTTEQMQAIAAEFNLSETTFVLPPADPANKANVRIFTPKNELPFAGHPNVGTGFVLANAESQRVDRYVFEEKAGLVGIDILRDAAGSVTGARIAAPQPLSLGAEIEVDAIAACAGLRTDDIAATNHVPVVASVGTPFVVAEVASLDALKHAQPNIGAFRSAADRYPGMQLRFALLLYVRRDGSPHRLRCRMFAPLGGVFEDPATGSANAALAALLATKLPGDSHAFEIEQGIEMGRPSLLLGGATKDANGEVRSTIAGSCVSVMTGEMTV